MQPILITSLPNNRALLLVKWVTVRNKYISLLVFGKETNEGYIMASTAQIDQVASWLWKFERCKLRWTIQQFWLLRAQEGCNKLQTMCLAHHRWGSRHAPEPNDMTVPALAVEIACASRFIVPFSSWNITCWICAAWHFLVTMSLETLYQPSRLQQVQQLKIGRFSANTVVTIIVTTFHVSQSTGRCEISRLRNSTGWRTRLAKSLV